MLRIQNLRDDGAKLYMDVLIEGSALDSYELCVDQTDSIYPVLSSSIPNKYRLYERQARMALRKYIGGDLPETIVSSWY